MRIVITYNLKRKNFGKNRPNDFCSEFDSLKTVNSIAGALKEKGHKVILLEANEKLLDYLPKHRGKIDFVFNISEGMGGASRESRVPAILDFLKIPYTGSGVFPLALTLDKAYTKKILKAEKILTPKFQLFTSGQERLNPDLKFPLIAKPNAEGSAKGIHCSSVVKDRKNLYRMVKKIMKQYNQPVIVEEFIKGRELTVGVVGNGKLNVLPVLEIDFSSCDRSGEYFYSWRMKEFQGDVKKHLTPTFHCPAKLSPFLREKIKNLALKTHKVTGCLDISRTDFRLDKYNRPYVLEINPLPGLDPEESNFPLMAKAAGIKYADLVDMILKAAVERSNKRDKKGGIG
jgi:D-alanine-D-alanine ligase